jgi:hypothetical protein
MSSFFFQFFIVVYVTIAAKDNEELYHHAENAPRWISSNNDMIVGLVFVILWATIQLAFTCQAFFCLRNHRSLKSLSYTDMQKLGLAPDRSKADTFVLSLEKENQRLDYKSAMVKNIRKRSFAVSDDRVSPMFSNL